jgi:hypothetical protein
MNETTRYESWTEWFMAFVKDGGNWGAYFALLDLIIVLAVLGLIVLAKLGGLSAEPDSTKRKDHLDKDDLV